MVCLELPKKIVVLVVAKEKVQTAGEFQVFVAIECSGGLVTAVPSLLTVFATATDDQLSTLNL